MEVYIKDVLLNSIHTMEEFKTEWIKQGGEIIQDTINKDGWLITKDRDNKVLHNIVLIGLDKINILPFNMERA